MLLHQVDPWQMPSASTSIEFGDSESRHEMRHVVQNAHTLDVDLGRIDTKGGAKMQKLILTID